MHGDRLETHADQRRGQKDRKEDVGGRRRHPDAEHEPGQRAHQEQQDGAAVRNPQQVVDQGGRNARHRQSADDQPHRGQDRHQIGEKEPE